MFEEGSGEGPEGESWWTGSGKTLSPRRRIEVLDLPRTEPARGHIAVSKTFHIPGINSSWQAESLDRPVEGIVTPNSTEHKGG